MSNCCCITMAQAASCSQDRQHHIRTDAGWRFNVTQTQLRPGTTTAATQQPTAGPDRQQQHQHQFTSAVTFYVLLLQMTVSWQRTVKIKTDKNRLSNAAVKAIDIKHLFPLTVYDPKPKLFYFTNKNRTLDQQLLCPILYWLGGKQTLREQRPPARTPSAQQLLSLKWTTS